ncbi:hypothetical protein AA313_de0208919 [Arthrobotrys entomopaga]|nr:hypothetical protein AA313_de0208919 [Arthrobotrys entomopaga]
MNSLWEKTSSFIGSRSQRQPKGVQKATSKARSNAEAMTSLSSRRKHPMSQSNFPPPESSHPTRTRSKPPRSPTSHQHRKKAQNIQHDADISQEGTYLHYGTETQLNEQPEIDNGDGITQTEDYPERLADVDDSLPTSEGYPCKTTETDDAVIELSSSPGSTSDSDSQIERDKICKFCENVISIKCRPASRFGITRDTVCCNCDINYLESELEKKRSILEAKNEKVKELRNARMEAQERLQIVEEECYRTNRELYHLRDEVHRLQAMQHNLNDHWAQKYNDLKNKFNRNEDEIGKLQRTELAMTSRNDNFMDEQAKQALREIFPVKIEDITRRIFRKVPFNAILQLETQALENILGDVFVPPWASDNNLQTTSYKWEAAKTHVDFNTTTLVDALLSCTLATKIFKDPFFLYNMSPDIYTALKEVYSSTAMQDAESAEAWKAKTVETTLKLVLGPADSRTIQNLPLQNIINAVSETLVNLIIVDHNPTNSDTEFVRQKVTDLVMASANLASTWHSKEFRLDIIDMCWLQSEGIQWGSDNAERYITPFTKKQRVEEGAEYEIVAVISPGFIRHQKGNESGSWVDIIWEKASVLLVKKESLSRPSET